MWEELERDKASYAKRQAAGGGGATVADDIGHLGTGADKQTGVVFTEAEARARSKRNARKETAAKLEAERRTFEARREAGALGTAPEELGHFAQETAAAKHSYDRAHATVPDAEAQIKSKRYARRDMAQESQQSKEAWEKRRAEGGLATVAEGGDHHYQAPTRASAAFGERSGSVPDAEAIKNAGRSRKDIEAKNLAEKEAWQARARGGRVGTKPAELGHFAQATSADKRRTKELRAHRKELRDEARRGETTKEAWAKRTAKDYALPADVGAGAGGASPVGTTF